MLRFLQALQFLQQKQPILLFHIVLLIFHAASVTSSGVVVSNVIYKPLFNESGENSTAWDNPFKRIGSAVTYCDDLGGLVAFGGLIQSKESEAQNDLFYSNLSRSSSNTSLAWEKISFNNSGLNNQVDSLLPRLYGAQIITIPSKTNCTALILGGTTYNSRDMQDDLMLDSQFHAWLIDLRIRQSDMEEIYNVTNSSIHSSPAIQVDVHPIESIYGPKPSPRRYHTARYAEGYVYVYGGLGRQLSLTTNESQVMALGDLWRLDLANMTWSTIDIEFHDERPTPRFASTSYLSSISEPISSLTIYGGISMNIKEPNTTLVSVECVFEGISNAFIINAEEVNTLSCGGENITMVVVCSTRNSSSCIELDEESILLVKERNLTINAACDQMESSNKWLDDGQIKTERVYKSLNDVWMFSFDTMKWTRLYFDSSSKWLGLSVLDEQYFLLFGNEMLDDICADCPAVAFPSNKTLQLNKIAYIGVDKKRKTLCDYDHGICGEGLLSDAVLPNARYHPYIIIGPKGRTYLLGGYSFMNDVSTHQSGLHSSYNGYPYVDLKEDQREPVFLTFNDDCWLVDVGAVSVPDVEIQLKLDIFISSLAICLLLCGVSILSGCFIIYRKLRLNIYGLENQEDNQNQANRRADKTLIDSIPLGKFTKGMEGVCAICLLEFRDEENVVYLPCKHLYHPTCIKAWLMVDKSCPLCKQDIDVAGVGKDLQNKNPASCVNETSLVMD